MSEAETPGPEKTLLACAKCSKSVEVGDYDDAKTYECAHCGGKLKPIHSLETAKVDTTTLERVADIELEESEPPLIEEFGKYRITRTAGRGAMGVIYEAVDTDLDRRVALKMMRPESSTDPKETEVGEKRFLNETKLTASLPKHPNIVSVYEGGVLKGTRYLVMEFIDGRSMTDWRAQKGITLKQQVRVLRDAALGVHHAHEHGIIHRDLKPENILVDSRNRANVTDFGVAKPLGRDPKATLTAPDMVIGTPGYMSPEYLRGETPVDRRTDVYALGVILFEIITDRLPFTGHTNVELMTNVLHDPVPLPGDVIEGKPPAGLDNTIEAICMKALAKSPRRRYQTAWALAHDLSNWLEGKPVTGLSQWTQTGRYRRIARARRYTAAFLLVAAVALFFVLRSVLGGDDLADAERYMKERKYREAAEAFERVLAGDPAHARALAGRAEAREKQEHRERLVRQSNRIRRLIAESRHKEIIREMRALESVVTDIESYPEYTELLDEVFAAATPVSSFDSPGHLQAVTAWKQSKNRSISHNTLGFDDIASITDEAKAGPGAVRLVLESGDGITMALPGIPFPELVAVLFWARVRDAGELKDPEFIVAVEDPNAKGKCRLEWYGKADPSRKWKIYCLPLSEFSMIWGTTSVQGGVAQGVHIYVHKPLDWIVDEVRVITGALPLSLFQENLDFEKGTLQGWENTSLNYGQAKIVPENALLGPKFENGEGRALLLRSNEEGHLESFGSATTPVFVPGSDALTFDCVGESPTLSELEVRILDPDRNVLRSIPVKNVGLADRKTGTQEMTHVSIDVADFRKARTPLRLEFRQHTLDLGHGWATIVDNLKIPGAYPPH